MPHPRALNARRATTSNFVLHGCETLPVEKWACDERTHWCYHRKSRNFLSVPDLKKQQNDHRWCSKGEERLHDMSTVVAADLTAATPIDRRQIIADWRKPKLGRLWKSSLATHAQLAANAVDMLESVNVTCRFTEVRALDLLMEETMTRHGRSLLITRATACTMRTGGELHESASGGQEQRSN